MPATMRANPTATLAAQAETVKEWCMIDTFQAWPGSRGVSGSDGDAA